MHVSRITILFMIFVALTAGFTGVKYVLAGVQNIEDVFLEGRKIDVAAFAFSNEVVSAAAYSKASGQYLVVYESYSTDNDIMGQFVDADSGDLKGGWFHIANSAEPEMDPALAYDPYQDRFLVVWSEKLCQGGKCYYVIQGRLVFGSDQNGASNLAGPEFAIANQHQDDDSGYDLLGPAVAYNQDDHQFAVVYEHFKPSAFSSEAIYGQMLGSHASKPVVLSGIFKGFEVVGAGVFVSPAIPKIAWSRHADTFLVVWEDDWPSDVNTIQANYLYDKYRGPGNNQVVEIGSWTVAPHPSQSNTASKDEYGNPSVAYDERNRNFVILYSHMDTSGILEKTTVYGQRFQHLPQPSQFVSNPLQVETVIDQNFTNHLSPVVVYSGQGDRMYVVYRTDYSEMGDFFDQVYQRTLRGDSISDRFLVHSGNPKRTVSRPAAAAANDGRALVVWEEEYNTEPFDFDIHGQRIKAYSKIFLPNVMKE